MNIKDIAQICGVSPSTVSKILNDKDESISLETRQKVLNIIKKYQFTPYAKILKNAIPKSNLLGVLMHCSTEGSESVLYEIEKAASDNGYSIILCNTEGSEEKANKYIHILEARSVDGIILLGQKAELTEQIKIPVVAVLETNQKTKNPKAADIYYEHKEMGYTAARYLLEKGHRKIGCILKQEDEEMEKGCIRACQEYGLAPTLAYRYQGNNSNYIEHIGVVECLNANVSGILCSNSSIAHVIYSKIQESGGRIPQGISVISLRDDKLAQILMPELSTVRIEARLIAKTVMDTMISILVQRKLPHDCRQKLKPVICERNSVMSPSTHHQRGTIVIVGSMNMDCIISVPKIPVDGETMLSGSILQLPGGKGANQAVGAARLDGLVYMIGRLGNDSDGKQIYNNLVNAGVNMEAVVFDDLLPTGKAYINVSPEGESTIVVSKGANERLDQKQIDKHRKLLEHAKFCLISLEIAEDAAEYAMQQCKEKQVQVILKPSSVYSIKESFYTMTDYFIPNQKELNQLLPGKASIAEKADMLFKKGVKNVIITLGKKGCYLRNENYAQFFPCADFVPVDTTGGADAFISTLAVYLSEGHPILSAIGYATYAAGINITRYGVQAAMTDRSGLGIYKEKIQSDFTNFI